MPNPEFSDCVTPEPPTLRRRRQRAPVRWWRRKRVQALSAVAVGALIGSLCTVYGRCDAPEPGLACHVCNVLRPVARFLALGLGV